MSSAINKNIGIILVLSSFFGFSSKAQLASNRPASAFYTDKVNGKLAESTANKSTVQPQGKGQNLPSNDPVIYEMAISKIKSHRMAVHKNSGGPAQDVKRKFPSNSAGLKQKGHPVKSK